MHDNDKHLFLDLYFNYLCRTGDIAAVGAILMFLVIPRCGTEIRTHQQPVDALRVMSQSRV